MFIRQSILALTAGFVVAFGSLPAFAEDVIIEGAFTGASGHDTSGTGQLVKLDDGTYVIRFAADFMHDGTAPDATVGLGKDGYDKSTDLGKLRENKGAQDYALPAGFDPAGYNEIYVWCTEYAVSLGVAKAK